MVTVYNPTRVCVCVRVCAGVCVDGQDSTARSNDILLYSAKLYIENRALKENRS